MALTSDTLDKKQRGRVQNKLNKRPANPEHSTKSEIPNHGTKNTSPLTSTLPADHTLLALIHINVSRGLRQNKACLWNATSHYLPGYVATHGPITVHPDVLFYGSSLIAPSAHARLPDSLAPTEAQMSCIHATQINVLPFPRMRENLIRRERSFDHAEFVADVVGDLVDTTMFRLPTADTATTTDLVPEYTVAVHGDDDEVTSDRNGLIVWGEPHRAESWEATPGFLRKWMWRVEGCEELLESSNRWRRVRGEEPMRLSIRQVTG
ncbi:hypothetical protein BDW62DRAFT_202007 [Aspergillus aurantiobrunneus]